jgi:hypothetical protein
MDQSSVPSLEAKHAGLEQQILEESQRPMPDDILIHRLKKEKLRIKEMLSGLAPA